MSGGMHALFFAINIGAVVALAVFAADRRQATGVVLAWLFPGAGYFYLGWKKRGMLLAGIVIAVFLVGMILADFRNISPFDRHPIWGLAHFYAGLLSIFSWLITASWTLDSYPTYYQTGCLYSAVGALMNILLMVDCWDLAERPAPGVATAPTTELVEDDDAAAAEAPTEESGA